MERFTSDNFANMNTSGTTEEYEDREILLQQIKEAANRFKEDLVQTAADKLNAEKELIAHGKVLRDASMARMHSQKSDAGKSDNNNPLMMMATAFKDMIEMSKPPATITQTPPVAAPLLTFGDAMIQTSCDYLAFAGIPDKWHDDYLVQLENFGFDTPQSLYLATGQQLAAAGIRVGHINLLLNARTKLQN
jgi:hypothetical protein